MGLEKFDDAIAEYIEAKRKHTIDALKLAKLSDSEIDQYCADIEKEILGFVKCNEAYAQLLIDLEHVFSKTYNLYSHTEIAKKKNHDNPIMDQKYSSNRTQIKTGTWWRNTC